MFRNFNELLLLVLTSISVFQQAFANKLEINITDAGVGYYEEDDIALIFYVTVKNNHHKSVQISTCMVKCCETTCDSETKSKHRSSDTKMNPSCSYMTLLGGDMGELLPGNAKNYTLIYPNMYILNRKGMCTVEAKYERRGVTGKLRRDIPFNTFGGTRSSNCTSPDQDTRNNCSPVDCVLKYSGSKSFYNTTTNLCQPVPICSADPAKDSSGVYSVIQNQCEEEESNMSLADTLLLYTGKYDPFDVADEWPVVGPFVCHNGELNYKNRCICKPNWNTTLNTSEQYFPTVIPYHMCNIETSSWNKANKGRLKTTALIILILALTIASKVLICMCVLTWCYKHFMHKKKERICVECTDEFDDPETFILCDNIDTKVCICDDLPKQNEPMLKNERMLRNETFNVTFIPGKTGNSSSNTGASTSISLSKTSSSMPISFESDSENDGNDAISSSESEDDESEVEFSEEDECMCPKHEHEDKKSEKSKKSVKSYVSEKSKVSFKEE